MSKQVEVQHIISQTASMTSRKHKQMAAGGIKDPATSPTSSYSTHIHSTSHLLQSPKSTIDFAQTSEIGSSGTEENTLTTTVVEAVDGVVGTNVSFDSKLKEDKKLTGSKIKRELVSGDYDDSSGVVKKRSKLTSEASRTPIEIGIVKSESQSREQRTITEDSDDAKVTSIVKNKSQLEVESWISEDAGMTTKVRPDEDDILTATTRSIGRQRYTITAEEGADGMEKKDRGENRQSNIPVRRTKERTQVSVDSSRSETSQESIPGTESSRDDEMLGQPCDTKATRRNVKCEKDEPSQDLTAFSFNTSQMTYSSIVTVESNEAGIKDSADVAQSSRHKERRSKNYNPQGSESRMSREKAAIVKSTASKEGQSTKLDVTGLESVGVLEKEHQWESKKGKQRSRIKDDQEMISISNSQMEGVKMTGDHDDTSDAARTTKRTGIGKSESHSREEASITGGFEEARAIGIVKTESQSKRESLMTEDDEMMNNIQNEMDEDVRLKATSPSVGQQCNTISTDVKSEGTGKNENLQLKIPALHSKEITQIAVDSHMETSQGLMADTVISKDEEMLGKPADAKSTGRNVKCEHVEYTQKLIAFSPSTSQMTQSSKVTVESNEGGIKDFIDETVEKDIAHSSADKGKIRKNDNPEVLASGLSYEKATIVKSTAPKENYSTESDAHPETVTGRQSIQVLEKEHQWKSKQETQRIFKSESQSKVESSITGDVGMMTSIQPQIDEDVRLTATSRSEMDKMENIDRSENRPREITSLQTKKRSHVNVDSVTGRGEEIIGKPVSGKGSRINVKHEQGKPLSENLVNLSSSTMQVAQSSRIPVNSDKGEIKDAQDKTMQTKTDVCQSSGHKGKKSKNYNLPVSESGAFNEKGMAIKSETSMESYSTESVVHPEIITGDEFAGVVYEKHYELKKYELTSVTKTETRHGDESENITTDQITVTGEAKQSHYGEISPNIKTCLTIFPPSSPVEHKRILHSVTIPTSEVRESANSTTVITYRGRSVSSESEIEDKPEETCATWSVSGTGIGIPNPIQPSPASPRQQTKISVLKSRIHPVKENVKLTETPVMTHSSLLNMDISPRRLEFKPMDTEYDLYITSTSTGHDEYKPSSDTVIVKPQVSAALKAPFKVTNLEPQQNTSASVDNRKNSVSEREEPPEHKPNKNSPPKETWLKQTEKGTSHKDSTSTEITSHKDTSSSTTKVRTTQSVATISSVYSETECRSVVAESNVMSASTEHFSSHTTDMKPEKSADQEAFDDTEYSRPQQKDRTTRFPANVDETENYTTVEVKLPEQSSNAFTSKSQRRMTAVKEGTPHKGNESVKEKRVVQEKTSHEENALFSAKDHSAPSVSKIPSTEPECISTVPVLGVISASAEHVVDVKLKDNVDKESPRDDEDAELQQNVCKDRFSPIVDERANVFGATVKQHRQRAQQTFPGTETWHAKEKASHKGDKVMQEKIPEKDNLSAVATDCNTPGAISVSCVHKERGYSSVVTSTSADGQDTHFDVKCTETQPENVDEKANVLIARKKPSKHTPDQSTSRRETRVKQVKEGTSHKDSTSTEITSHKDTSPSTTKVRTTQSVATISSVYSETECRSIVAESNVMSASTEHFSSHTTNMKPEKSADQEAFDDPEYSRPQQKDRTTRFPANVDETESYTTAKVKLPEQSSNAFTPKSQRRMTAVKEGTPHKDNESVKEKRVVQEKTSHEENVLFSAKDHDAPSVSKIPSTEPECISTVPVLGVISASAEHVVDVKLKDNVDKESPRDDEDAELLQNVCKDTFSPIVDERAKVFGATARQHRQRAQQTFSGTETWHAKEKASHKGDKVMQEKIPEKDNLSAVATDCNTPGAISVSCVHKERGYPSVVTSTSADGQDTHFNVKCTETQPENVDEKANVLIARKKPSKHTPDQSTSRRETRAKQVKEGTSHKTKKSVREKASHKDMASFTMKDQFVQSESQLSFKVRTETSLASDVNQPIPMHKVDEPASEKISLCVEQVAVNYGKKRGMDVDDAVSSSDQSSPSPFIIDNDPWANIEKYSTTHVTKNEQESVEQMSHECANIDDNENLNAVSSNPIKDIYMTTAGKIEDDTRTNQATSPTREQSTDTTHGVVVGATQIEVDENVRQDSDMTPPQLQATSHANIADESVVGNDDATHKGGRSTIRDALYNASQTFKLIVPSIRSKASASKDSGKEDSPNDLSISDDSNKDDRADTSTQKLQTFLRSSSPFTVVSLDSGNENPTIETLSGDSSDGSKPSRKSSGLLLAGYVPPDTLKQWTETGDLPNKPAVVSEGNLKANVPLTEGDDVSRSGTKRELSGKSRSSVAGTRGTEFHITGSTVRSVQQIHDDDRTPGKNDSQGTEEHLSKPIAAGDESRLSKGAFDNDGGGVSYSTSTHSVESRKSSGVLLAGYVAPPDASEGRYKSTVSQIYEDAFATEQDATGQSSNRSYMTANPYEDTKSGMDSETMTTGTKFALRHKNRNTQSSEPTKEQSDTLKTALDNADNSGSIVDAKQIGVDINVHHDSDNSVTRPKLQAATYANSKDGSQLGNDRATNKEGHKTIKDALYSASQTLKMMVPSMRSSSSTSKGSEKEFSAHDPNIYDDSNEEERAHTPTQKLQTFLRSSSPFTVISVDSGNENPTVETMSTDSSDESKQSRKSSGLLLAGYIPPDTLKQQTDSGVLPDKPAVVFEKDDLATLKANDPRTKGNNIGKSQSQTERSGKSRSAVARVRGPEVQVVGNKVRSLQQMHTDDKTPGRNYGQSTELYASKSMDIEDESQPLYDAFDVVATNEKGVIFSRDPQGNDNNSSELNFQSGFVPPDSEERHKVNVPSTQYPITTMQSSSPYSHVTQESYSQKSKIETVDDDTSSVTYSTSTHSVESRKSSGVLLAGYVAPPETSEGRYKSTVSEIYEEAFATEQGVVRQLSNRSHMTDSPYEDTKSGMDSDTMTRATKFALRPKSRNIKPSVPKEEQSDTLKRALDNAGNSGSITDAKQIGVDINVHHDSDDSVTRPKLQAASYASSKEGLSLGNDKATHEQGHKTMKGALYNVSQTLKMMVPSMRSPSSTSKGSEKEYYAHDPNIYDDSNEEERAHTPTQKLQTFLRSSSPFTVISVDSGNENPTVETMSTDSSDESKQSRKSSGLLLAGYVPPDTLKQQSESGNLPDKPAAVFEEDHLAALKAGNSQSRAEQSGKSRSAVARVRGPEVQVAGSKVRSLQQMHTDDKTPGRNYGQSAELHASKSMDIEDESQPLNDAFDIVATKEKGVIFSRNPQGHDNSSSEMDFQPGFVPPNSDKKYKENVPFTKHPVTTMQSSSPYSSVTQESCNQKSKIETVDDGRSSVKYSTSTHSVQSRKSSGVLLAGYVAPPETSEGRYKSTVSQIYEDVFTTEHDVARQSSHRQHITDSPSQGTQATMGSETKATGTRFALRRKGRNTQPSELTEKPSSSLIDSFDNATKKVKGFMGSDSSMSSTQKDASPNETPDISGGNRSEIPGTAAEKLKKFLQSSSTHHDTSRQGSSQSSTAKAISPQDDPGNSATPQTQQSRKSSGLLLAGYVPPEPSKSTSRLPEKQQEGVYSTVVEDHDASVKKSKRVLPKKSKLPSRKK